MRNIGSDAVLIATHSARLMVNVLIEEGCDVPSILDPLGLTMLRIEDPDSQITIRQEIELQRVFARLTQHRPGLWYRVGLNYGVLSFGSLGQASLCAETVGEALTLFTNSFQDLNYSLLSYGLVIDGQSSAFIEASDEGVDKDLLQFSQERSLGSVERIMRDLAPGKASFVRIESALKSMPGWMDEPVLSGAPITFGHARSRWFLTPGLAQTPLLLANGVLETTYRRLCEKMVERMNAQAGLVSRVYLLLLHGGMDKMNITRVAQELCLHERTLQRKLAESGLTFSDIVIQVREQKAKLMLRTTDLPIGHIAEALGFTEIGSFSHAFKRWTGESPLDYRKNNRGIAGLDTGHA